MYQALYRKWRPKVFADVIAQPHITETLRRQVAEGRTSHAYLFTGTRGTGKTTCAKILAKAVNCEQPVNGDPCGQCPSCLGIENGGFLDVLEIDAASNSGVDQVRALRSEAIYSPANVKRRVYIIDEVHMLSDAAFNALLKILEEPPEHLMFILATTEVHKILPTILSRCQRFSFRRIPPQAIAQRLAYVAEQEGMDLTPEGGELLSRLSDGALRDGLSLLDQCAASGGTIDAAAVLEVLGLAGNLQTAQLMESILKRDAQDALMQLDRLYNNGKDMGAVLSELAALTRDLLLRKTAPEGGAVLLSGGYDTAALDRLGRGAPGTRFLYLASTLQKASAELYFSANRRLDAELCLLRLCDESLSGDLTALAARVQRLEEAPAAIQPGPMVPPAPSKPTPPPRPAPKPSANEPGRPPWEALETSASPPWKEPPPEEAPSPEPPPEEAPLPEPPPEEAPLPEPPPEEAPLPEPPPEEAPLPEPPEETPSPKTSDLDTPPAKRTPPPVGAAIPPPPEAASGTPPAAPVGNWWPSAAERCKGRLSPMYRAFLDTCTGVLEGEVIVIYAPNAITIGRLDNERVRTALIEEAQSVLGQAYRLVFREGSPPMGSPEENLKQLLQFGSQYDNVEVK